MMINKGKCLELGLPEPKAYDTQETYILRSIAGGCRINTRMARYINIHNLHSVISALKRKMYDFTLTTGVVACPMTKETPPYPVDIVYMTKEQRLKYKEDKPAPVN